MVCDDRSEATPYSEHLELCGSRCSGANFIIPKGPGSHLILMVFVQLCHSVVGEANTSHNVDVRPVVLQFDLTLLIPI